MGIYFKDLFQAPLNQLSQELCAGSHWLHSPVCISSAFIDCCCSDFFLFGFSFSFNGNVIDSLPTPSGLLYLPSWGTVLAVRTGVLIPPAPWYNTFLAILSSLVTAADCLPRTNSAGWTCGIVTSHSCCTLSCIATRYYCGYFVWRASGMGLYVGMISLLPHLPICCWCWGFSYAPPERLVLNMSSSPHLDELFPEDLKCLGLK